MSTIFNFGEVVEGYTVRVLNERELRAGAGILFFFAMISFMNAFLVGNYIPLSIFVTYFLIEFIIRVLINPTYAPSLILGRIIVAQQTVEYTGAPQKRFAWSVGLAIALIMFVLVVIMQYVGPINFILCALCLIFLLFESAFGICLGCKMYNIFHKEKAQLCPGGVCEEHIRLPIQHISAAQYVLLGIGISIIVGWLFNTTDRIVPKQDCDIPDWVIEIGHEDMYKLHHNCE